MSGGSFNYMYSKIIETYGGEMCDPNMEQLLADFCKVLHDLEWWQSGDIAREDYGKTVKEFMDRWSPPRDRSCYPVTVHYPSPIGRHYTGGYFDPTRQLLFTGYMTAELATHLGITWEVEEIGGKP